MHKIICLYYVTKELRKYPVMNMNVDNWRYRSEHFELYRHVVQNNMKNVTMRGGVNYVFKIYFVNDLHCFQNIIRE
jgi:hypothetical protein